jgi:hypothetical protein
MFSVEALGEDAGFLHLGISNTPYHRLLHKHAKLINGPLFVRQFPRHRSIYRISDREHFHLMIE